MKNKFTLAVIFLCLIYQQASAQLPRVYTVENTGSAYPAPALPYLSQQPIIEPLPDPFMWADGSGRSTNFSDWEHRRNEIKAQIENYEIGTKPPRPDSITATFTRGTTAGSGTLRVVVTKNGQTLTLSSQVSFPTVPGPWPAVIGMNSLSGSVPATVFTNRNIARITFSHNNVTTYGNPQLTDPYFKLYPEQNLVNAGQYSAWAWGVSRIIDGLELVQDSLPIDLKHLAVTGCSYAGKMALFAGAFDERIALTIAQESGGGGAPAWRVSETLGDVEKLGATDYTWFRDSMRQYAGSNVSRLPHDHHELMAMVAPRALLVTGNTDFTWLANPSCYVSARATKEVYKTFGVGDRFGFYIDGGHGHCAVPAAQVPVMQAFVDKFLLDRDTINTDTVGVNPFPNVDYKRWYQWWGTGNPVLPAEPIGRRIWLEAECAQVGSSWNTLADTAASNGLYIMGKLGLQNLSSAATSDTALAVFKFRIDSLADYIIRARVNCPTADDDSYWIKIDNGSSVTVNGLNGSGWQWVILANARLDTGMHTITICYREDGAKLDKLLITTSNATINGAGVRGPNCGTAPVITPGQTFLVNENAADSSVAGTVAAIDADAETVLQKWTITGGTGAALFSIDANTGQLIVKDGTAFDFESATNSYTLTFTVSDGYYTSTEETATVSVTNVNDNTPVITAGLSFRIDAGNCNGVGTATATDADDSNQPGFTAFQWQITGGTGKNIFSIDPATGKITITALNLLDMYRSNYSLLVTVSDGAHTSAQQTVTITIPDKINVCHNGNVLSVSRAAVIAHIYHGDCIGTCGPGPDYPALKVTASPNPSRNYFQVSIRGGNPSQSVSMKVYTLLGGLVEQRQGLQTNQDIKIGQNYRTGIYLVEFTQGLDKEALLLIKL